LLLIAFSSCICAYGQKIKGTVSDKSTKQPVSGALVSLGSSKTYTNTLGEFAIAATDLNDSLKISHFAYKIYSTLPSRAIIYLHIELEPKIITLKEVTVRSRREDAFKKDSIENRMAYAKQFNYKGPTLEDALTGNADKQPGDLISLNPLTLIAALTKKSSPEYKFSKILLRDEQDEYVSRKFNGGIVTRITGLKGDTLSAFLTSYRPTYKFAKKASDYDMEIYIKDSYKRFKNDGFPSVNPFGKP
jgi:hypothetical protein